MDVLLTTATTLTPGPATALDGRSFGLAWTLPFAGILLSIAILPQVVSRHWEYNVGKVAAAWAVAVLVPLAATHGLGTTLDALLRVFLHEYLPFILLLTALYAIAGGIVLEGNLHGSPGVNTAMLALGTGLASLIGTTGASLIMIRPLLRANDDRRHNVHVVVFFIFLVSNIGGSLTPLGDPPLFLGFLRGVDFFWTTRHLLAETLFCATVLLALFYALDKWWFTRDARRPSIPDPTPDDGTLRLRGGANLILLASLGGSILLAGVWRPGVWLRIGSTELQGQDLVRDAAMVALASASLAFTERRNRVANGFTWTPIVEVAKIFAAIFVCLIPVTAALAASREGAFAPLFKVLSRADGTPAPAAYFWLAGALSAFLDNAPTYLVFFESAGGDARHLMVANEGTLAAISSGAVYMGAMTYIGNAPNFMVFAIARGSGVKMPSFIGYIAWSSALLLPLFVIVTFLFFF